MVIWLQGKAPGTGHDGPHQLSAAGCMSEQSTVVLGDAVGNIVISGTGRDVFSRTKPFWSKQLHQE